MTPNWTPRKRGKVFCSPACGRGCTLAEHAKATKAAARLVKRLGWDFQARVWENLGWHYEIVVGKFRIDEYWTHVGKRKVREYQASYNNSAEFRAERSTPEAALDAVEQMLHDAAGQLEIDRRMLRRARETRKTRRP